jgi:hypothetical protein
LGEKLRALAEERFAGEAEDKEGMVSVVSSIALAPV